MLCLGRVHIMLVSPTLFQADDSPGLANNMFLPLAYKLIDKYFKENNIEAEAGKMIIHLITYICQTFLIKLVCITVQFDNRSLSIDCTYRSQTLFDGAGEIGNGGYKAQSSSRESWYTPSSCVYVCMGRGVNEVKMLSEFAKF